MKFLTLNLITCLFDFVNWSAYKWARDHGGEFFMRDMFTMLSRSAVTSPIVGLSTVLDPSNTSSFPSILAVLILIDLFQLSFCGIIK